MFGEFASLLVGVKTVTFCYDIRLDSKLHLDFVQNLVQLFVWNVNLKLTCGKLKSFANRVVIDSLLSFAESSLAACRK